MKPIVGEKRRDGIHFQLPNDISLVQVDKTKTNLRVYFGDEQAGILSNIAVQRLFEVILYPPGSVPSTERGTASKKLLDEQASDRPVLNDGYYSDIPPFGPGAI